jgi:hypothetical protein
MITVKIDDKQVRRLIASLDKHAIRAAEQALDKTAVAIAKEIQSTMKRVFDSPVPYTINSLKVTKTKNHNMVASVWFKDPERMSQHYLVPQVEGGQRKEKGFERATGSKKFITTPTKFIPSEHLTLDKYGNVKPQLIRQILSVLGAAEISSGHQANLTKKSAVRNQKDRDFVWLPRGAGGGKLPPGVYRRVIRGNQISAKQKRFLNRQIKAGRLKAGTYQQTQGGSSIARAKGLMPVLIVGKQRAPIKPLLPFYDIAAQVYQREFRRTFDAIFSTLVRGQR